MSASCCDVPQKPAFTGASKSYRLVLWAVIAINGGMFLFEVAAGWSAGSQALQADALDFLADTATYGASLWAISKSASTRAGIALAKGVSLGALAIIVLGTTLYRVLFTAVPEASVMGGVGVLALMANLGAAGLLLRFRDGDANVRSVWLCTRNDAIGNLAVVAAAAGVWGTGTPWPDLAVAFGMTALFLWSSARIITQARGEIRQLAPA